jgi:hypothetical protein
VPTPTQEIITGSGRRRPSGVGASMLVSHYFAGYSAKYPGAPRLP